MVSVCQSGLCEWSPRGVLRDAAGALRDVAERIDTVRAAQSDDQEWTEIEQAILRALLSYPEARLAVVREIDRISQKMEEDSS